MYPPVTQFETRDNLFREEARLRQERQALHPQPQRHRAPRWLARSLRAALPGPRRARERGADRAGEPTRGTAPLRLRAQRLPRLAEAGLLA